MADHVDPHDETPSAPFRRVLSLIDGLPPTFKPSDETPLREAMPGGWPTIAEFRSFMSSIQSPPPSTHVAPVRLKPLEWKTLVCSDRHAEVADSVLGRWEMWSFPNGSTHIMKPGEHQGSVYEDTPEEAKAYLERVYQRRMAPALATTEGQP